MSFFANSNICVSSRLILIVFSPHYGSYFPTLFMPINLLLDVKHCEFYLVGFWLF